MFGTIFISMAEIKDLPIFGLLLAFLLVKKEHANLPFYDIFFLVSGVKFVIAARQQGSQKKEKREMGGRLGLQSVGCYLSCE